VSFVVDVKPSARKRNAKAGRLVFEDGSRRTFGSRAAAERWAADLSAGDGHVYLLSRATNAKLEAAYDKRRRRVRGEDDTEQASLEPEPRGSE